MAIDLNNGYDDLRQHIGHSVAVVCYGVQGEYPENVAIECEDCSLVLLDFDRDADNPTYFG